MAFIRWKENKFGVRQAYLVHSYRDEHGRPRHKMLAYLGKAGELKPEHIAALKEKHASLQIQWDNIKAVAPSKARQVTDISGMSDESLLRSLRGLRRERGITIAEMLKELHNMGLTAVPGIINDRPLSHELLCRIERLLTRDEWPDWAGEAGRQIAPFARKVLTNK